LGSRHRASKGRGERGTGTGGDLGPGCGAGARNCFVLALSNREGDGVVLNYLAGTGVRVDLKEVRDWQSQGLALTAEEEQAVARARADWGSTA
jgi:hypothetical protein